MTQPMQDLNTAIQAISEQPQGADLRAAILAPRPLATKVIPVPEWGVSVEVREMKAKQRQMVIQSTNKPDGTRDMVRFYPLIVINSAFDPNTGMPIFEAADLDALNEGGGTVLERLCQVAVKLSGLDAAQFEETKKD